MMRLKFILALMLFCIASYGQLTVNKGFTAQQLGNNLAGANINIINPTIVGDPDQYGLFNFVGTGLGMSSGVILSTGDIDDAVGPNSDDATSTGYGRPGNADLSALAGFNTQDAVVFEFEFEVQGDELEFNFQFLSEEYNEFVNSGFNDVFAFYISGPGIVGQENLAVVPGTTTPVTINSINNGSFWQFYRDNDFGSATVNIEFDGFTTVMKARKTGLLPCNVYRLSLRIADGSDDRLDSGVLLQENSLVSNSIAVTSATYSADTTALEGCIPATYTFNLGATAQSDLNIPIRLGGTALNGVDYQHIDSIITIPAGQTSSTVIINALADGITEGRETIALYYKPSACAPEDTVYLYIDDATSINFDAVGTNLTCNNNNSGSIAINISGGSPPYNVTYIDTATGVSNTIPATALPLTGLSATSYLLRISDQYGCTADAIVVGGSFSAGATFLPDGTGVSYTSNINITGFSAGQTLNDIAQINSICTTMEHSYANDLTIEIIAPNGQSIQLKAVGVTGSGVNTCDLGEPIASGPVDNWSVSNTNPGVGYQYCWTNTPTYGTMNDMISPLPPGPPPSHTFTTLAGNTYTDYYLPAGSYAPRQSFFGLLGAPLNGNWTLRVTDNFSQDNGYIFDWAMSLQTDLPDSIVTLTEPVAPVISHTAVSPPCGASTGSIDLTISGSNPFTFLWSNGATTEDITGLSAGSYIVTATDATGCPYTYSVNISNTGAVTPTANISNETCVGSNNGAIDLSVGAGTFTYNWSNGSSNQDITNLSPGTYIVTVVDGTCLAVNSYTVNAAALLVLSASITNENCGDQEGAISLSTQGGAGNNTYLWSNGATSQVITDLQQGPYQVTVTDANGCAVIDTFTVINLVGNCIPSCDLEITSFLSGNENCADATGFVDITTFTTSGPTTFNWSNGAVSQDIANLSSGIYAVTISDAIGCTDTMSFNIVNQTGGLNIPSMNTTNQYCGNNGGAIDAAVTGGALPYSYLWSNGRTTQDLTGIVAGTYTLTVTDGNGCKFVSSATITNNSGNFVQTYGNAVDEICSDGSGSIDIIFTGGQQPYSYNWSNGAVAEDLTGLSAGTYTCTVVDDGGCSVTTPSYVINNNAGGMMFNNIDVDNETCSNGLGEITLAVSGGQIPYTYTWNTGATTSALNNLSAGTFSATVTDNSGCVIYTNSLNLANNSGTLSLDAVQTFDETCGSGTGSVDITVSGNTGPLTYTWNNFSASEDLINLSAGNYNCTITDSVGCAVYANATVQNDPGALTIDNMIVVNETCGNASGSISVIISGAAAPTDYLWSNGSNNQNLTNLQAGNYALTITDAIGCTVSDNAIILNNTGTLALNGQILSNEICGNSAGSINISVSGGTAPLAFLWSNGATTEDLTALSAGTYTCTITDASNCALMAGAYNVNNSSGSLTQGTHIVTNETCGNGAGAINITINGGAAPVTYLWSNAETTEDLTGLSAGTYTVTISDASGCSLMITRTVTNTAGTLAISNAVVADENCTDGAGLVNITVTGGTPTYIYNWSNAATSQDLNNLNAGIYAVTITDANGCMVSNSYTVNNNSPNFQLSNIDVTNENCGDGTGAIDITLLGGQTPIAYIWSNGATVLDLTGLSSGAYTGTATDVNGCKVTYAASVQNDPGSLAVTNNIVTNATCGNNNGSIALTVANGTPTYSYLWSNGGFTSNVTGLTGGNYTCVITDAAGCQTTYSATIQNLGGNLQIANASIVDDACNQGVGAITATVTGGGQPYNYSWTAASSNPCCSYTLNMFDLNNNGWGGTPAPSVSVFINGTLFGSFTIPPGQGNASNSATIPVCTGDVIAVQYNAAAQNGNNTYELLDASGTQIFADGPNPASGSIAFSAPVNCSFAGQGSNTISGLYSGSYSLTVTDNYGCTVSQNYTVNNNSGLVNISLNSQTDETCGQGNAALDLTISGAANLSVLWSNGATTQDITGLNAGIYTVTATDLANGCFTTATYTIINNANGMSFTGSITNETCGNGQGAINLTITGGATPYSFAWSNGSATEDIIFLAAGNYTVTVTDATGCDLVQNYTIINNANGITASSTTTNEICGNSAGSINMTVTGGAGPYTFDWSNGASTEDINGLFAGIYTCTITDATSCMFIFADTITNTTSTVNITSATINNAFCGDNDGDVILVITGGATPLTFNWSNGATSQNINNVLPGNYTLTITESNGCSLVASYLVGNNAFFGAGDTTIVHELCGNGAGSINITITGGGPGGPPPLTYIWSNGATTQDISGLSAGTYTVTMTSTAGPGGGCTGIEVYTVLNNLGNLSLDPFITTDESCAQGNGAIDATLGTSPCTYTLDMDDSFGDGWNGGSLDVLVDGISVGTFAAVGNGSSANIIVPNGSIITLVYAAGNFENENSYSLILNGATIFSDGPNPSVGQVFSTSCGGTGAVTYLWNTGATTQDLTGLNAGTYTLTVTDNNGCMVSGTTTLSNNTFGLGVAGSQLTDENCGDAAGAINLTISGGLSPYTYNWSNGATSEDLTALSAGTYNITITDNAGCSAISSYLINNNTNNFISSATINNQGCLPNTGALNLTLLGGVAPYTFLWSNNATTEDITGLSAGTYNVTVTDALGCRINNSFTVGTSITVITNTGTVTVANCTAADGTVNITPANGNLPYTYNWSNGATTQDLSGVVSGTYVVTISDAGGCSLIDTFTVGNSAGGIGLSSIPTPATCGLANGGMTLNVSGGVAPYSFAWSNGATTQNIAGVVAGNYGVTITAANGCALAVPITIINIGNPVDLTASDTTTATCSNCSNGGVDITVGGTGAPYTYSWSNNAFTQDLVNVLPGTYTVTITNVDGCALDTSFVVGFATGIVQLNDNSFLVYPNPTKGTVYIEFSQTPTNEVSIEIFNALGQLVITKNYNNQNIQQRIDINIENAASGTYMLRLSSGNETVTKRIVVTKE